MQKRPAPLAPAGLSCNPKFVVFGLRVPGICPRTGANSELNSPQGHFHFYGRYPLPKN